MAVLTWHCTRCGVEWAIGPQEPQFAERRTGAPDGRRGARTERRRQACPRCGADMRPATGGGDDSRSQVPVWRCIRCGEDTQQRVEQMAADGHRQVQQIAANRNATGDATEP